VIIIYLTRLGVGGRLSFLDANCAYNDFSLFVLRLISTFSIIVFQDWAANQMLRYLSCFDGKNDRLLHEKKHNKTLLLSCMIVKSYRQKNSFLFARKFINKFDFFISVMKPKIIATVKLRTFSHTLMLNCAPFKISWWLFSTSDHLHIREL